MALRRTTPLRRLSVQNTVLTVSVHYIYYIFTAFMCPDLQPSAWVMGEASRQTSPARRKHQSSSRRPSRKLAMKARSRSHLTLLRPSFTRKESTILTSRTRIRIRPSGLLILSSRTSTSATLKRNPIVSVEGPIDQDYYSSNREFPSRALAPNQ